MIAPILRLDIALVHLEDGSGNELRLVANALSREQRYVRAHCGTTTSVRAATVGKNLGVSM